MLYFFICMIFFILGELNFESIKFFVFIKVFNIWVYKFSKNIDMI